MAMNDRVSDMITRLRNAGNARLPQFTCKHSKLLEGVCQVLEREGYIRSYEVIKDGNKTDLRVEVKYHEGEPVIRQIKRISKPGLRKYSPIGDMQKVKNGLGISIMTTSKGVMSDFEARQQNVGGEVLCSVF